MPRYWVGPVLFLVALGTLRVAGCGDGANPCMDEVCRASPQSYSCGSSESEDDSCYPAPEFDGFPCVSNRICVQAACKENDCGKLPAGAVCKGRGSTAGATVGFASCVSNWIVTPRAHAGT